MSFELVQPGQWRAFQALSDDEASISKSGQLCLTEGALQAVGITGACAVLADPETLRLALRPLDSGEEEFGVRIGKPHSKSSTKRRTIGVSRALHKLSLEAASLTGSRYKLTTKGSLLIVNLTDPQLSGNRELHTEKRRGEGHK